MKDGLTDLTTQRFMMKKEKSTTVTSYWRIKFVSTYDPQAYGPTPFSPRDSLGSCQSAEQGDYKRLIYLYLLNYPNHNLRLN
jgi:hypothetical protein